MHVRLPVRVALLILFVVGNLILIGVLGNAEGKQFGLSVAGGGPEINRFGQLALVILAIYLVLKVIVPQAVWFVGRGRGLRLLAIAALCADLDIRFFVVQGGREIVRRLTLPEAGGHIFFLPIWAFALLVLLVVALRDRMVHEAEARNEQSQPTQIKL